MVTANPNNPKPKHRYDADIINDANYLLALFGFKCDSGKPGFKPRI
jgi:hypothetical protein